MSKKRKKKVAKKAASKMTFAKLCPACGMVSIKNDVCTNCNYGRKPGISD